MKKLTSLLIVSVSVFVFINHIHVISANTINDYLINQKLPHSTITTSIWTVPNKPDDGNPHVKIGSSYSGFPTYNYAYSDNVVKPNKVIVHETASNASNDTISSEVSYMKNHYGDAFVHSFVSDKQILNIANTDYLAWGSGYFGNQRAIQFEQVRVNSKAAFAAQLGNAAYYTAMMLVKYDLIPSAATSNGGGTVWAHNDVSNFLGGTDHTDPTGYWADRAKRYWGTTYTMTDFLALVKQYYNKQVHVVSTTNVEYVATINQDSRTDGINMDHPATVFGHTYVASATTTVFKNKQLIILREATTSDGVTWAGFYYKGRIAWIDKRALINLQNIQKINTKVTFQQTNRNDGVFMNGTWGFANQTKSGTVTSMGWNNKGITVTKQYTGQDGLKRYGYVTSGKTFWFDSRAVVNSIKTINQAAYVGQIIQNNRKDGIFANEPAGVDGRIQIGLGTDSNWNNKSVMINQMAMSNSGIQWAGFIYDNKETWIDARALKIIDTVHAINKQVTFDQTKRNDGVFNNGSWGFADQIKAGTITSMSWWDSHKKIGKTILVTKSYTGVDGKLRYGYVINGITYWFDASAVKSVIQ